MSPAQEHPGGSEEDLPQPRARKRGRAKAEDGPIVVGVRPGPEGRRTPLVLVDVRLGPAVVTFGFAWLRRDRWEVRCPVDDRGTAAVRLPSRLLARVVEMVREAAEHRPR
ncbi:hypothetical protein [Sabulicella glaciei]|uniref:Uncharacterized protein n=1 Tax=Sabulicella glaciei TaxID=2984948 RepID=A0ABT3P1N2_9PROT|nr:hypothetical protein [Roseococcus sp. MDT2-1-1]MCW8088318.1 hypothetical protein [Roseococcus sp. MDT2-1-1]